MSGVTRGRRGAPDLEPVRAYLTGLGYPLHPEALMERPDQRPSTLCYLTTEKGLLMLRRKKEPFAGHWTAPGGKIQDGEDPAQAIVREMREETQLTIVRPRLKAVCSEVGGEDYNWLLFIFRADECRGELTESDEGELRWIPLAELQQWKLPDVDRHIMKYVLGDAPEVHYIRVRYAPDHRVADFHVRPLSEMAG